MIAEIHKFMAPLMTPMGFVGILGQSMYFFRFLIQWIASERRKESTVPVAFWYLSIAGAILVIIYWFGTPTRDRLLILGQGIGLLVYVRNLMLCWRKRS